MNTLTLKAQQYIELARLNRPIGIYLLLWQTLWALWLAADGVPSVHLLVVFILGVVLMRSAGCVINDYADRNLDSHVERTQNRPLATGRVSAHEALGLAAALAFLAFILVLTTNVNTVLWSFGAVALAAIYPFMKRYTHLPQVVLGMAFSWSAPMAFAAQGVTVGPLAWLLFASGLLWIVAYDTLYAMVDREDDLKVGIRSTAVLFGDADKLMVGLLQGLFLFGMLLVGRMADLGPVYYLGLLGAAGGFAWQHWLIRARDRAACFRAFLHNHWVGLMIFISVVIDRALI